VKHTASSRQLMSWPTGDQATASNWELDHPASCMRESLLT
jgi:hypothetical protein